MRIFAFGLLVFYHASLIFVECEYHIQNDTLSEGLKYPLLFIISGACSDVRDGRRSFLV